MLSAPWVVGPITPCSRKIKLQGLLRRAHVHVLANGIEVGAGAAEQAEGLIDLAHGVELEPGSEITAWQQRAGDTSQPSPVPYRVLLHPTLEALGHIFLLAPPVACGTCLGLGGIVPGATVRVQVQGVTISVVAEWSEVLIPIPNGFGTGPFTVQQTACAPGGRLEGPVVTFPPPLHVEQAGAPLPAPLFEFAPQECQQLLWLRRLQPGATGTMERSAGKSSSCFGALSGAILLPDAGLANAEDIRLVQQYDLRECRRAGALEESTASAAPPPPPWFDEVPRVGNAFVTVGGVVPGAEVHVFADGNVPALVVGTSSATVAAINLPKGWSANILSVQQVLCEGGAMSAASTAAVLSSDGPSLPQFADVSLECATGVAVEVAGAHDWEPGLSAGTLVLIVSKRWHGVIGRAVATGDHFTDVELWLPLVAGDQIHAEVLRCGQSLSSAVAVPVDAGPTPPLPAPQLEPEVDDCSGSIWVKAVPGDIVDLEQVPAESFDPNTAGVLLACMRVSRGMLPVPVPPLAPGALLRARSRRCAARSAPSARRQARQPRTELRRQQRVPDRSAHRRVGSGRASAPERHARHCPGRHRPRYPGRSPRKAVAVLRRREGVRVRPVRRVRDRRRPRSVCWTADAPEPDGPTLHFPADDTGFFVQLVEEAVGAAIGGGIGAALGFLGGGVAAALAGGAGGAVIGAVIGWFFDVIPDKTFRRLAVKDLPALDNFEVPTGGFSYNDRVFLFVARDPADVQGEKRMRLSHVAVSKNADPANNFDKLHDVSSIKDGVAFPAGRWLVHVSPTVIRNSDWPDLPSSQGDGLFMFGTSLYHASNLRLAWAPLTPGQDPPAPGTWRFFAETSAGSAWLTQVELSAKAVTPKMLLDDVFDEKPDAEGKPPQGLGEMSVSWSPQLRRWILTYSMDHVECRVARDPRGPWTKPGQVIFRRADPAASADNGPDTSPVWVGLTPTDAKITRKTVSYAPYQIPRWTRFDRSTRKLTIYYTLSVEDPPYNPQLMRARLTCR